ncbi:DHA2 family efflux MFS transporter permease subunit [Weissella viridescens]|uniref:DHA2 family efflux MFS transporter permease subunit n=1 Tax=Weissella viridescens TaxID=1629 RepID=A0A3P2RGP6_WEIVI|nr:MFS transporter [Weissella viridescens]RRG18501.1 DHA2 family efflux MFS transporter permease subunit [Weissella viridescens]
MSETKSGSGKNKWIALIAMSLGVFMALLDVTVVNVALPTMAVDFKTTFSNLQWVLNAYTIVFASILLIVSKLGDMYGRKKIFMISMVIFVVASAINGMATSLPILIAGRALQAIGGAGLNSLSMALVASNFEGKSRGTGMGILGSVIGLSTASGPLVGGYLVETFGWPSIFFVNVPIGIIAFVLSWKYVKETPSYGKGQKIDFLGMLLSGAGLFTLVYGLIEKEQHFSWAWTDPRVMGWLLAGVVLLIVFILVELKSKHPMMNLKLFKHVNLVGAIFVAFALGAGVYAINAYLTTMMQNYMGYSAFSTGVHQLVMSIWALLLGPITGRLGNRFSKRWMIAGFLGLGVVAYLVLAVMITPNITFNELVPGLVLLGISNAMVNPLVNNAGLEGIEPSETGMASGIMNVFRQFGVTVGIVMLGLTQSNKYEDYVNGHWAGLHLPAQMSEGLHHAFTSAGPFAGHTIAYNNRLASLPQIGQLRSMILNAYNHSMIAIFIAAAIVMAIGAVAAGLLMRDPKEN